MPRREQTPISVGAPPLPPPTTSWHTTGHSIGILLGFYRSFCWDTTGILPIILLGYYWDLLLGFYRSFCWDTTRILPIILLGYYWDSADHSVGILLGIYRSFYWDTTGILLIRDSLNFWSYCCCM